MKNNKIIKCLVLLFAIPGLLFVLYVVLLMGNSGMSIIELDNKTGSTLELIELKLPRSSFEFKMEPNQRILFVLPPDRSSEIRVLSEGEEVEFARPHQTYKIVVEIGDKIDLVKSFNLHPILIKSLIMKYSYIKVDYNY